VCISLVLTTRTFLPHSVFVCSHDSHYKQPLFPLYFPTQHSIRVSNGSILMFSVPYTKNHGGQRSIPGQPMSDLDSVNELGFLRVMQFSPVTITPPKLLTHPRIIRHTTLIRMTQDKAWEPIHKTTLFRIRDSIGHKSTFTFFSTIKG
jgi:hypothetical protein